MAHHRIFALDASTCFNSDFWIETAESGGYGGYNDKLNAVKSQKSTSPLRCAGLAGAVEPCGARPRPIRPLFLNPKQEEISSNNTQYILKTHQRFCAVYLDRLAIVGPATI